MLYRLEVGSGKEHVVSERVYANYKGTQNGGETEFGTGCLKI
jgi:hypothetical protein